MAADSRGAAIALRHGTAWINDFHPYLPQAEWGGFGGSGRAPRLPRPAITNPLLEEP